MKRINVCYATRTGHTQRIAEYVARILRSRGVDTQLLNLSSRNAADALTGCAGIILAASVRAGKHEPEMVDFVMKQKAKLDAIPSLFLSVSLSEVGAERDTGSAEDRERCATDVRRVIESFIAKTGWRPARVKPVAGALMYSKYNPLIRWVMKRIAKKEHADTDTSRDYDYTDWNSLGRIVEEFEAIVAP